MHTSTSNVQDTVFERTVAGQSALLSLHSSLNTSERRLLAVINGFTPLAALRTLLNDDDVCGSAIKAMTARGLIRTPEHHIQHFFFGWPCGRP